MACFHVAYYASGTFPAAGLLIIGYAFGLVQLASQPSVRRAFYFGFAAGFLCAAPQLYFFWKIFSIAAIVLWIVFAFWIGLFTAIVCGCLRRWGKARAMWLIPFIWTGLEYFRSELYYLKFSWLNIGYVVPVPLDGIGMYGIGFVVFLLPVSWHYRPFIRISFREMLFLDILLIIILGVLLPVLSKTQYQGLDRLSIAGIQMEFPPVGILPKALDKALKKNPEAQLLVLSEYTLDGEVPDSLKQWCRENSRYLVVGGKDFVTNDVYYNTAFVVGTNGEIVFQQAKSVPIQFFHDGLPAPKQEVWNSPWGKIGICICYVLSYTRVTDALLKQGAQLLIVPTMDVDEWGRHEHRLHARVAPVRAAEYGVPIFRLASSGISQAIRDNGQVIKQTKFQVNGDILAASPHLPPQGRLPWDRWLAPVCVAVTAIITAALLLMAWNEKRAINKIV